VSDGHVCPDIVIDYIKNIKINSPVEPTNKPRDEVTEILNFDKTETDEKLKNNEGNIEEVENENIDFEQFVAINTEEILVLDKNCSQQALTRYIVENNFISLVPSQGAFVGVTSIVLQSFRKKLVSVPPELLVIIIFWLQK
jgi:hypothetical protein